MSESDLIGVDPCTTAESAARLQLSKEFTTASFDYGLDDQRKLLDIKFVNNETATKRTSSLVALKGHVASSTNKIIKLFGNLHASEEVTAEITQRLADHQKIFRDKGILSDDFDGTTFFTTLDQHTTDMNDFKAKIAGVDFQKIRNLIPRFDTLEGKIGTANLETVDRGMRQNNLTLQKLAILTTENTAQTMVDSVATLQPFLPHVTELLDLRERVRTLEAAPAQHRDSLETMDAKVETVTRMLAEMKQLKAAIDSTPAAQNTIGSQFGQVKIPELTSLEPSEFKTWRGRFMAMASVRAWTDSQMKTALLLAVPDSKVFIPLKLATPNYDDIPAAEILDHWEKRCCPDSYRDLANANLSQLHQGMDEASDAYIDRATQLYIAARFEGTQDPESDQQFILRLINSFRDSRLRAPLRRRKPKSLSELRMALNEEVSIMDNDPSATSAGVQAIGSAAQGNPFDKKAAKGSPQKNQPIRCHVCKELHVAAKCPLVLGIITAYDKSQKQKNQQQQKEDQSQNNKGKNADRGRGRGRGGGRGGRGRGGNFRRPNEHQGQSEGEPPQKAQKFEKFDNQKN